jgi:hypothetical protein
MRGRVWLAWAPLCACLDIPPFPANGDARPGDAGPCDPQNPDRDADGWRCDNARAPDCNDGDPAINPGEIDDPASPADEDCFAATGDLIDGVSGDSSGMSSGDLRIEFNSMSGMPSVVRIGEDNTLGTLASSCLFNNEEGLGIALYPAFGMHPRTPPVRTVMVMESGPAFARTRVSWTAEPVLECDQPADATIAGTIDFMVLPRGRLARHDSITIAGSGPLYDCTGPMNCNLSPGFPVLTTYASFRPWLDRYELDDDDNVVAFPVGGAPAIDLPPEPGRRICVTGETPTTAGVYAKVGMNWQGAGEGQRIRNAQGNNAVVFDWSTNTELPMGTYEASSALFVQLTGEVDCTPEMWDAVREFSVPPLLTNQVAFRHHQGMYVPQNPPTGGRLQFAMMQDSDHGFAVQVDDLGGAGVTVWVDGVRGAAGHQYLIQGDGPSPQQRRYIVYFPSLVAGREVVIAAPGSEPPAT